MLTENLALLFERDILKLKTEINAAIPAETDRMTKYHLQDLSERISRILDPKQ